MDLRLITILPSQPTQGVQQPAGTQGNTSSGLTSLAGIPSGTTLTGFIINRDSSGNPVLRTEGGDITFASNFFLKIGVEVQIRVEQTVNNTIARLLTVDGQPPETAQARSSFSESPDVILSQALASRGSLSSLTSQVDARAPAAPQAQSSANTSSIATNDSNSPAITIKGTVIASSAQQQIANALRLPEGSELVLKLLNVASPSGNVSAQGVILPTTSGSLASYAAYTRATGTSPAAQQTVPVINTSPAAQTGTTAGNTTVIAQPPVAGAEPLQAPLIASAANVKQNTADISAAQPSNTPASGINNSVQVTSTTPNVAGSAPLTVGSNAVASGVNTTPAAINTSNVAYTPQSNTAVSLQPGQLVTGTVIGNEPTGEALVQTSLGLIRLQPGSTLPAGSSISFELVNATIAQTHINALAAGDEPANINELARGWSSLAQIFALLSGRDNASSIDFVQPNMPWLMMDDGQSPQSLISPQNMPSGLLMFLAALKGEDFKSWIGRHNSQWLEENGHGALIKKAGSEFASLARQFNESTATQPWQTMIFPVAVEGEVQQVRFYVKRDKKQNSNRQEGESEDTRFVVEVDLSQLGEIQMDGFVRKGGQQQVHFDLMVRSKLPLPSDVQQDIFAIYQATGELTGYQGNLQFQSVKEFPVNPAEELAIHPHNNVVV